jgi:hypothetical protein
MLKKIVPFFEFKVMFLTQKRTVQEKANYWTSTELPFLNYAQYQLNRNLSAWVTAFIESQPDTGIEEIEKLYSSIRDRTRDELEEVLIFLYQGLIWS